MIPRWSFASSPLISGMTSGTSGSIRKVEELSITIAPASRAIGANSRATAVPALNSARSIPRKESGASSATGIFRREIKRTYRLNAWN